MATPGPGVMGTGGGGGAGGDPNWRAAQFRSKVVAQINDALRDACNPIEKSGSELENHIYMRAKDRDGYLSLVARLILHMRDSNAAKDKDKALTGRMTPNMAGLQQDPMVALQGLTTMGQPQNTGMQMQPNPGQMVPGVPTQGNRPVLRNPMGQPQGGLSMDQRHQQMAQKLAQKLMSAPTSQPQVMPGASLPPGVMQSQPGVPQAPPQPQQSQMPHFQGGGGGGIVGGTGGMTQGGFQGPAGGGSMTPQPQPGMPGGPQGGQQMHMAPGQMTMQQQQGMMQQMQQVQQVQQVQRGQQNFQVQNQMVMSQQPPQPQMQPRPQVARTYSGQPTPPPQSVVTNSPAYQQQQSPAQPNQQVPTPGSNPLHSPASYFQPSPSPQGHSIPSPASGGSQRGGPPSVPSPSSTLSTPGNPGSVGSVNPSPGGGVRGPGSNQSQADQVAYNEKMRQLSKYIEPLKKAIQNNSSREDGGMSTPELTRMKSLLDFLTNPNKKITLQSLLKCEQILENFDQLKPATCGAPSTVATTTTTTPPTTSASTVATTDSKTTGKPTHMFQPLLEVVKAHINSPSLNHSLQRTYGPALTTLQGTPPHFPAPPAKRVKTEHDSSPASPSAIPNIIQGEVARLAPKFRVNLDPLFHSSGKDVHLVCRLDDRQLPSVPPISIAIPEQYPTLSPNCDVQMQEYAQTPFLKFVQRTLQSQLMRMPDRFTLTQVLDAWEMSVRKSCLTMIAARDAT